MELRRLFIFLKQNKVIIKIGATLVYEKLFLSSSVAFP